MTSEEEQALRAATPNWMAGGLQADYAPITETVANLDFSPAVIDTTIGDVEAPEEAGGGTGGDSLGEEVLQCNQAGSLKYRTFDCTPPRDTPEP